MASNGTYRLRMGILEQQVGQHYRLLVRQETTMHEAAMGTRGLCRHATGLSMRGASRVNHGYQALRGMENGL